MASAWPSSSPSRRSSASPAKQRGPASGHPGRPVTVLRSASWWPPFPALVSSSRPPWVVRGHVCGVEDQDFRGGPPEFVNVAIGGGDDRVLVPAGIGVCVGDRHDARYGREVGVERLGRGLAVS